MWSGLLLHAVYLLWLTRMSVHIQAIVSVFGPGGACKVANGAQLPTCICCGQLLIWMCALAESWPQALALLADPRAAPTALALLNDVVDTAWHAAGDRSSDFSWWDADLCCKSRQLLPVRNSRRHF
jgi:COQ9